MASRIARSARPRGSGMSPRPSPSRRPISPRVRRSPPAAPRRRPFRRFARYRSSLPGCWPDCPGCPLRFCWPAGAGRGSCGRAIAAGVASPASRASPAATGLRALPLHLSRVGRHAGSPACSAAATGVPRASWRAPLRQLAGAVEHALQIASGDNLRGRAASRRLAGVAVLAPRLQIAVERLLQLPQEAQDLPRPEIRELGHAFQRARPADEHRHRRKGRVVVDGSKAPPSGI